VSAFDFPGGVADAARATAARIPTACPACRSQSITTTARTPDEHAYWRCSDCGEVWNAARREADRNRVPTWRDRR
jgi:transposase-like protein